MNRSKKPLVRLLHGEIKTLMESLGFAQLHNGDAKYFRIIHDDWMGSLGFNEININPSRGGRELLPIAGLQHLPTVDLMTGPLGYGRALPVVAGNIGYLFGNSHVSLVVLSSDDVEQVKTKLCRLVAQFLEWAQRNAGATEIDQLQIHGIYCPDREFVEPAFLAATGRIIPALEKLEQFEEKVLAPGGVRAAAFIDYAKKLREWASDR